MVAFLSMIVIIFQTILYIEIFECVKANCSQKPVVTASAIYCNVVVSKEYGVAGMSVNFVMNKSGWSVTCNQIFVLKVHL